MRAKNTLIFPRTDKELIDTRHFLLSRNRPFQTEWIGVKDGSGTRMPMIITEMDFMEKLVYRACYKAKTDRINVFG